MTHFPENLLMGREVNEEHTGVKSLSFSLEDMLDQPPHIDPK